MHDMWWFPGLSLTDNTWRNQQKVKSYSDSYEIKEKIAKADAEMTLSALFPAIITSNDKNAVAFL